MLYCCGLKLPDRASLRDRSARLAMYCSKISEDVLLLLVVVVVVALLLLGLVPRLLGLLSCTAVSCMGCSVLGCTASMLMWYCCTS